MLYFDLETFNTRDISVGTFAYAEAAEVLLAGYAVEGGEAKVWDVNGEPTNMPRDLLEALGAVHHGELSITAHNAIFDRTVAREALYFDAPVERWRCTMAKAYAHGFPGNLDQVGRILRLPQDKQKLKEGKKLINRFCKPAPSNHKADRYDRHTHPAEWERFIEYARMDIVAMREIDRRLPDWNYRGAELALYHLDQKINDRGFYVDRDLVEAGARAAAEEKDQLAKRFRELTDGAVEKPTQRDKFRELLNDKFNLDLTDTKKTTFEALLEDPDALPEDCRELMQISIMANKTSNAKYAALAPAISKDVRFRGGLQFAGAARTRRWAGRGFQPHNLPSRGLPKQKSIELYIEALKNGVHDLLFDDLMLYGSASVRGVVIAPKGRQLVVSDLSNIEGRGLAWLAGEQWKIKAYEAFDRGEGPDLYNVTAGSLIGKTPEEIDKTERQVMGKVPELALGYQGGVGAFQQMAGTYGVDMLDHWPKIRRSLVPKFIRQAEENYDTWGRERAPDMDKVTWIASESVKLAWRARHPATVALWHNCEEQAIKAVRKPGAVFQVNGKLRFCVKKHSGFSYLLVRLPSGNFLCYFDPRVSEDDKLSYMGVNGVTRQWQRISTYGGKIVENVDQSLSRDVMGHNMPRIEAAGFNLILTVHDETVTETPVGDPYTAENLSKHLRTPPPWADGFPLAASGFVADRYQKD